MNAAVEGVFNAPPPTFGYTFGESHTQASWGDTRHTSWPQMVKMLTSHVAGPKEGPCVVPAIFSGARRRKEEATQIDVAFLDSDSGATLDEIVDALKRGGWAAVVSSTHSHMTTRTIAKVSNWDRYFAVRPGSDAAGFLRDEKGYLPVIAEGASVAETVGEYVHVDHAPCPKFRIAIPLLKPWRAADYPSQAAANGAWKERIEALAATLKVSHDQACTDTSRLFYLPRRPPNGAVPETAVISGELCDIFALAAARPAEDGFFIARSASPREALNDTEYADPITGEVIDLMPWVRLHGRTFLISKALKARRPAALTGLTVESKIHIDCPNGGAHTSSGRDNATFVCDAGSGEKDGFVVHCRHAHCTGKDRLFFVQKMLQEQWLKIDDLTAPEFHRECPAPERPVLSPSTPLDSARTLVGRTYTHPEGRTLHHQHGEFFIWRGSHYAEGQKEVIRADVYKFLDDARCIKGEKVVPFAPNKVKVANVMEALAAETQLPATVAAPAWLDDRPHPAAADILPCANGLLDLPSRRLMPLSPTFFGMNAVDYRYDADAAGSDDWIRFLLSVWPDDQETIDTLQEIFGLLLTGDTSQQKAFLIVGPKRSGKGTIARILTALLGRDNVVGPTLSSLTQNFGLAPLIGKPLAIISDARLGGRTDTSVVVERLLAITGEDGITVDRKFRDPWTGRLPTRFVMLTNELPRLTDASGALVSRFVVLVMKRSFFGQEDAGLTTRLLKELPAILNWAIDGRDRLLRRGHFIQPAASQQAAVELADIGSPIGAFLRDRCDVADAHSVSVDGLYNAWGEWCLNQNREHVGTKQIFGRDLRAAVPGLTDTQPRGEFGARYREYRGVGLKP